MTEEKMTCNVCSRSCSSSKRAHELGWDWFTGYLPMRFIVCRECLGNEHQQSFINSQREISQTRPTPAAHRPFPKLLELP